MSETDREALAEVLVMAHVSHGRVFVGAGLASAILASDWLAQVKATARAEALEEAVTAIEDAADRMCGCPDLRCHARVSGCESAARTVGALDGSPA